MSDLARSEPASGWHRPFLTNGTPSNSNELTVGPRFSGAGQAVKPRPTAVVLWENIKNGNMAISNVESFDRFEIRIFTSVHTSKICLVATERSAVESRYLQTIRVKILLSAGLSCSECS